MIFCFYKVRRDGASRPTDTRKWPASRESTDRTMPRISVGDDSISAHSVSRNRLFSFSAAVYGCTVGRAFTPAASPILQRKRCFAFFEYAEVRRAKSPALQCKANARGRDKSRPYEQNFRFAAPFMAACSAAQWQRNRLAFAPPVFASRCARFRGIAARRGFLWGEGCGGIYCAAGRGAGRFRNRLASLRLFLHRAAPDFAA